MGQFLFDVPDVASDFIAESLWQDAYICGIEGVPFQSRNEFDGNRLVIHRDVNSSGKLHMACPVPGIGLRTLSTCSLRSLENEVHLLPLEFARGSCYRARVQSDIWQRAGLVLTDDFNSLLKEGTEAFLEGAGRHADPAACAEHSIRAIEILESAMTELGDAFCVQSIAFRKKREPKIGTLLAGTVVAPAPIGTGSDPQEAEWFKSAFNSAAIRMSWAEIETDSGSFDFDQADRTVQFCAENNMRIIGGPLIDFRKHLMPHWLYLFEDDFESLLRAVVQYVEKTVDHFRGKVQLWNCAAGLNTPGPFPLDDEQSMRMAVGILQAVRRTDPNTPAVMSFDQPFGEYLGKDGDGISPLHFADALIRSGLGMAGIGLECRFHYRDHGTHPRSTVDFGLMIDRWATLGMPMLVQLAAPGGIGADEGAQSPVDPLPYRFIRNDTAAEQLRLAGPLIRTLLAKHVVHGIVWDGWNDAEPHVMQHSGLIDGSKQPRPLLEYLTRLRREFLA